MYKLASRAFVTTTERFVLNTPPWLSASFNVTVKMSPGVFVGVSSA